MLRAHILAKMEQSFQKSHSSVLTFGIIRETFAMSGELPRYGLAALHLSE